MRFESAAVSAIKRRRFASFMRKGMGWVGIPIIIMGNAGEGKENLQQLQNGPGRSLTANRAPPSEPCATRVCAIFNAENGHSCATVAARAALTVRPFLDKAFGDSYG